MVFLWRLWHLRNVQTEYIFEVIFTFLYIFIISAILVNWLLLLNIDRLASINLLHFRFIKAELAKAFVRLAPVG